MDDRIFLGVFTYMFLSILISGFLPSELYTGSTFQDTSDEFLQEYDQGAAAIEGTSEQVGFFTKVIKFFFVAWVIDGIPAVLGVVISLFNMISLIVAGVWIYDKVRGIGS